MSETTYSTGQIMDLDQKVSAILEDILGHDTSKELQEKTGLIHLHDTKIGKDVMDKKFTSSARAETAIKQAVIGELLERLPEGVFINPTIYDPNRAIQRLAALILSASETGDTDAGDPAGSIPDIDENTEV